MKIKDIVRLSAEMCNVALPERYFATGNTDGTTDAYVKKFVSCCNLVLDEIACDYAHNLSHSTLTVINNFASVPNALCIVSLKDYLGNNVPYRETSGGIVAENGTYNVVYTTPHVTADFDDDAVVANMRLTARSVAYGVASEYYLLTGEYELANIWNKRFKDALAVANVKESEMKMPKRRWL